MELGPKDALSTKQTLRALMPQQALDHTGGNHYAYAASAEHQEGVQAVLAKRPPKF